MKKLILASACAVALAVGGAMAQTQPVPGASSPGVSKHATHMKHAKHLKKPTTGQTTGMAPSKAKQPSGRY